MKKSLFILALLFVPIICSAQILEKSVDGEYRISIGEWKSLGITVKPEAQKYDSCFTEAISNPNKKILVKESEKKFLKLKFLFKKRVEVKEKFIVYNSKTKTINYLEVTTEKEEVNYVILFGVISLILMIISNVLYKKDRISLGFALNLTFLSAIVTAFFTISSLFLSFFLNALLFVAAFAIIFIIAVLIIEAGEECKVYKISSIAFYILMVTAMVLLFV